ncbi:MAG: hypothetical protein MI919_26570 [Holophagales bacterium]|nr:hypothetical protein [Holophagales bacterium]
MDTDRQRPTDPGARAGAEQAADPASGSRGPRAAAAVVVGAAMALAYAHFEQSLPRGPSEFAFWPALQPLPFAAIRGQTYEQWARILGRLVLLGPSLLLISWGLARIRWPAPPRAWRLRPGVAALALAGLGIAFGLAFQLGTLRGRALVDDELTYAWQAELLAQGRLVESRLERWAPESFTVWTARGATGKYLFGAPLVQIPGVLLGIPALLHLPLLALACALWYRVMHAAAGPRVAVAGTALVALSPMVLLTSATGLSHTASLFAMVAAGWGISDLRRAAEIGRTGLRGALVAGSALGFGFTVRPQVALSFGAVLAACWLLEAWRARRWRAMIVFFAAGAPWLAAVLTYDQYLTGSPFALPWTLFSPQESYGFGRVLEGSGYLHTPWRAFENLLMVAVRLNTFLLGWPLSLGLLGVWWAVGRPARGTAPWVLAGLAQTVFHLGYYTPGISGFGALYHFELVLPFAFLGGYAIAAALERRPRLAAAALAVHLVLGTGWFLAEQSSRLGRMASLLHDRREATLSSIEPPALLIYEAWPSEQVYLGWVGFPLRTRHDAAPVVTYPRSGPGSVASLRNLYADRACWYYRVDPATMGPDLRPCSAAEHLLARPFALEGPKIAVRPTAMALGYLPPPE